MVPSAGTDRFSPAVDFILTVSVSFPRRIRHLIETTASLIIIENELG
jgi:hypothetical protein